MLESDLRVLLIDLDDTIYDRTPHRFGHTLTRVASCPLLQDFAPESLVEHVETIRALSPMFEELGYPRTQDRTDRRLFLAGIFLVFGSIPTMVERWGIAPSSLRLARQSIAQFRATLERGPPTNWRAYLVQRLLICRALTGPGSKEVCEIIERLRTDDQIVALARQAADNALWESRDGFLELWSGLRRRGVNCYVASEGEDQLQREKLASLGLDDLVGDFLLTSERAASPLDSLAFQQFASRVFSEAAAAVDPNVLPFGPDNRVDYEFERRVASAIMPDMAAVAAASWVLSNFARKTPGYYSRILHAIIASPTDPQRALDGFAMVTQSDWSVSKPRVAMFGNYHAKDVMPIQQLLGRDCVWTGLLDEGLHRGIRPSDAAFVPSQTFTSWDSAAEALRVGIPWDDIRPAEAARFETESDVVSLLNRWRENCPFEVIGKLADFLAE